MKNLLFVIFFINLTGCSVINSQFSCNKTATDCCLTIEEVDAMTRFADRGRSTKSYSGSNENIKFNNIHAKHFHLTQDSSQIWLAPNKGVG